MRIIYAHDENDLIGRQNGKLPWTLQKGDMEFFRNTTKGHTVIVGRKTMDGIGKLPGRNILIVSRDPKKGQTKEEILRNIEESDMKNVFVIGGAEVYKEFEDYCDTILETVIHSGFPSSPGDVKYSFDKSSWILINEVRHDRDEKNEFPWTLRIWSRTNM